MAQGQGQATQVKGPAERDFVFPAVGRAYQAATPYGADEAAAADPGQCAGPQELLEGGHDAHGKYAHEPAQHRVEQAAEHFLGQLTRIQGGAPLAEALAIAYSRAWYPGAEPLTLFADGHVKPLWTKAYSPAGHVTMRDAPCPEPSS
jgi:hypothetical protein